MRGAPVVRVVAATLAAIALVSGYLNLTRSPDQEHSGDVVEDRLYAHQDARSPVAPLRILLTATNLNPAERRLQATVTITRLDPRTEFIGG